jgi:hypothetical protein
MDIGAKAHVWKFLMFLMFVLNVADGLYILFCVGAVVWR